MDPNPKNFPILSYVLSKLPSMKNPISTAAVESDIENPQPAIPNQEPHFDLSAQMPHLKNPSLINQMRHAVSEVSRTRSALQALGPRPDHETLDFVKLKLSELSDKPLSDDYKMYKSLVSLDEMHDAYEGMLSEAEGRLQRIYEAAVSGDESLIDEGNENEHEIVMNEEVARFLKDVEMGKAVERADLIGKGLSVLPEAFGRAKTLVVLNLSENKLKAIPDSISGLENLEELNVSSNMLESLPDSIGLLFKLKILDVSRNKLFTLPDSICQCRSLVELDASFNKLTYLPTNIGFELVNLKKLSIHLNKIRALPTSIGEMKSLCLLDAHFNELHGLPDSIGKLTNLEILNVSSNFSDLTELPSTISDLINLKEFECSNNQIHALPATFGRLVSLTKLNVEQNPLVIPPTEVVNQGVEAVKAYMTKRWADMVEEEQKKMNEMNQQGQAGLLTRSTSWLSNVVSSVSGSVSGYLGGTGKTNDDSYLNQQL